jgi:hypothetical protein
MGFSGRFGTGSKHPGRDCHQQDQAFVRNRPEALSLTGPATTTTQLAGQRLPPRVDG